MARKTAFFLVLWIVYAFVDYFYLPYYVKPFSWLLVCVTLMVLFFRQVLKVIKERNSLQIYGILNLFITSGLFFLTFYNFNKIPNSVIEKIDWSISYSKRNKIVEEVLRGELKPNTKMNNGICRLSFDFPIISNGGNDIWIYESETENKGTVKFWISRGFFDSPQTYFIFTNDNEMEKMYEEQIKRKPRNNWKLEENWYRIMERD